MTLPTPIALLGVPGSPYTRKMLAVLRYRRIPYRLILGSQRTKNDLPKPKVQLLPTFYLPNAAGELEAVVDSTPIIRRLEAEFSARSVIPDDPVIAFLDYLLEDYGDEWLTKAMFHYRWYYKADIENAARILPRWSMAQASEAELAAMGKIVADRQISRLYVVGSNDTTAPVIEQSYRRYLQAMSRHLERHGFTFGGRPGASDFAAYGQLTQLARFDPTPMELANREAPRVAAWTDMVEDLSGLEPAQGDWIRRDAVPQSLKDLLVEVGRVYVPVMLANARALMTGAARVETEVDGRPWIQQPFPYQGKCLKWLRGEYAKLTAGDRGAVDAILDGTGCERLLRN
jgi:glutathione S-transferase